MSSACLSANSNARTMIFASPRVMTPSSCESMRTSLSSSSVSGNGESRPMPHTVQIHDESFSKEPNRRPQGEVQYLQWPCEEQ